MENEEINKITSAVIGSAIEVHRELGPGFLESLYEEALAIEMKSRGISFTKQHEIHVSYKTVPIGKARLDFLVEDRLVVELKAVETLLPIHMAQVISYLKTTGHPLGLLINFNVKMLKQGIKRVILH